MFAPRPVSASLPSLPPKAEWKRSAPDSEVTEREDATFNHPWPDMERAEREAIVVTPLQSFPCHTEGSTH